MFLPDIHLLKNQKVRKISCVYFLFVDNNLVYIGKTTDLFRRIVDHQKDKIFNNYSYLECKQPELTAVERHYIQKYNPVLNTVHSTHISNSEEIIDINTSLLKENTVYINCEGNQLKTRVQIKVIKGFCNYKLLDIKGEVLSDGSRNFKNLDFTIIFKKVRYYFKSNRNNTWKLIKD